MFSKRVLAPPLSCQSSQSLPMPDPWQYVDSSFENFRKCWEYLDTKHKKINQTITKKNKQLVLRVIDIFDIDEPSISKNTVVLTNTCVQQGVVDPGYYEQFEPSIYGMYAGQTNCQNLDPILNFNCFINRMDVNRQSWFYQLIKHDILNQGYVSFNMDISRHVVFDKSLASTTPFEIFENQFRYHCRTFRNEHEIAKNIVPYRNFDINENLNDIIMKTKFSIVLETYFHDNRTITVSEKIFRCLKLPRPWVLFGTAHVVKYLRGLGFDVLDDVVDHSYDDVEFAIDRQCAILNQVKHLCNLDFEHTLQSRLQQAAVHNNALLNHFRDCFESDVDKSFAKAVEKLNHLC